MIRTPSKAMMVSSSPGRAEKLPAPMLTTLLRGKGGNRSRGRSSSAAVTRSSPMFTAARRRSASADVQEQKEPSSPKVTCIGQVRISKRKSSAPSGAASSSSSRSKPEQGGCVPRGCRCLRRGFFCNPFSKGFGVKFKPSPAPAPASPCRHRDPRGWRKWFLLPRPGCYRQRKPPRQQRQQHRQWQEEAPPRMPTGVRAAAAAGSEDDEGEGSEQGEGEDDEGETKVFVPTTPPKNALLLMRCRSAPHRAASVPDRFWAASPYAAESDGAAGSTAAAAPGGMEPSNIGEEPINGGSVSAHEARAGSTDGGAGEPREGEDDDDDGEGAAAVGPSPSFSSRPLILTRCKSEPARTAAKLAAPDASYCFWNSGSNPSSKPRSKNSSSNNKRWLTLLGEARPIPSQ